MAAAPLAAGLIDLNIIINQYDPPKDLIVGGSLNLTQHGLELQVILNRLFGPVANPADRPAVGGRKYMIEEALDAETSPVRGWKNTGRRIVRLKHSSSHNPCPENFFLAQDNGPIDIISNPKLILTPGSLIDPAGKTKVATPRYTVINHINGPYSNLPIQYINNIGLNTIINGQIRTTVTMVSNINVYRTTMPFTTVNGTGDNIIEDFARHNFNPQEFGGVTPSYFAGNREKNQRIASLIVGMNHRNIIHNRTECEKYILCKLMGDALQIEYVAYMLDNPGATGMTRGNTVVGTTDDVVLWRCIVNKVGVIHTNSLGVSTYYPPINLDQAALDQLNEGIVLSIKRELLSHNLTVIKILREIIENGRYGAIRNDWIDDLTWNRAQIDMAIQYLTNVTDRLATINQNIDATFLSNGDRNVDSAKKLAVDYKFISPFVKARDFYKRILTTKSLLPYRREVFVAKNFLPTTFSGTIDNATRRMTPPLIPGFSGGGILDDLRRLDIPYQLNFIGGFLYGSIVWPQTLTVYNPAVAPIAPDPVITLKVRHSLQADGQSFETVRNILQSNAGQNLVFVFVFIRDYFPELLTYANYMKVGCQLNNINIATYTHIDYTLFGQTILQDAYDVKAYRYNENLQFILGWETLTGVAIYGRQRTGIHIRPSLHAQFFIETVTEDILKYAFLFLQLFPYFKTEQLTDVMETITTRYPYTHVNILPAAQANHTASNVDLRVLHEEARQVGGGMKKEFDDAASIAIGLYEFYYMLELQAAYENKNTNELIIERIINILEINVLLSEGPDEILEKQLGYFVKEAESLPNFDKTINDLLKTHNKLTYAPTKAVRTEAQKNKSAANLNNVREVLAFGGRHRKTRSAKNKKYNRKQTQRKR